MKELINRVIVTGKLVKSTLEEFQTKKGEDAIGGSLVLRTDDNSEHEIRFFAYKFKKDENKNFTAEESYFYQKYMDARNHLKDIEHCSEGENPDIISITDGMFDFVGIKAKPVIELPILFLKIFNGEFVKDSGVVYLKEKSFRLHAKSSLLKRD